MDKILGFIKRIFSQLIKIVIFVIKEVFYLSPFLIILPIAYNFVSISVEDKFSIEQLRIIIASTGLTSILSGLSFRASSSSKNEIDNHIFYIQALRFFYATLLLICAIPLAYTYNQNNLINNLAFVILINRYFNINMANLINALCFNFAIAFFNFGLLITAIAMASLHKIFFTKKLLD
jgi:hypothetical protein